MCFGESFNASMKKITLNPGEVLEVCFTGETCRVKIENQYPSPEDGIWAFVWREGADEPEAVPVKNDAGEFEEEREGL